MKTTIISLFTAGLLGLAATLTARPFDAADCLAIAFATGLVAWTVNQYGRKGEELRYVGKTFAFEPKPVTLRAGNRHTGRIAA